MPKKPMRTCAKPGCPNLTSGRFCDSHQKQQTYKRSTSADKKYDAEKRDQRSRRFYKSRAWQHTREKVLSRDKYLCQECLRSKRITQADTVHHIVPIRDDWNKRLDLQNLESLCASCHNEKHTGG